MRQRLVCEINISSHFGINLKRVRPSWADLCDDDNDYHDHNDLDDYDDDDTDNGDDYEDDK